MAEAKAEISHYSEADYLIVNDNFDQALAELEAILVAKRLEDVNEFANHQDLIRDLLS